MHTHETASQPADKATINSSSVQPATGGSFEFNDQRPETVAQLKLQEMADQFSMQQTPAEGVVQREKILDRPKRRSNKPQGPYVATSDNFDTNHLALADDVTDVTVKAQRAARKLNRNTMVKKTALVATAATKRAELVEKADAIPGTEKLTALTFKTGDARTATYNGPVGGKAVAANATLADVTTLKVMTRKPEDKPNTVEIFHIEDSEA